MVGNLSPEPPSNFDDQITQSDRDGRDFVVQDSDDESTVEDNGYQLLSQSEYEGYSGAMNEEEDDEPMQGENITGDALIKIIHDNYAQAEISLN